MSIDYEQQRRDLLHKYGIDLNDGSDPTDGMKTKRLDRKEINRLMGGENGEGLFTWREKNRKKVLFIFWESCLLRNVLIGYAHILASVFCVSFTDFFYSELTRS